MRMPGLFCEFSGHGFGIDVPGGAYRIYGIVSCTRKWRITSTESFRVRERCVSHLRNHFEYVKVQYRIYETVSST